MNSRFSAEVVAYGESSRVLALVSRYKVSFRAAFTRATRQESAVKLFSSTAAQDFEIPQDLIFPKRAKSTH